MKMFLHTSSLCSVALATVLMACAASADAQSTRAIAAVESRSAQPDSAFHTVGWRNGYYGRGYGYYGRPYAGYYAPRARYYQRYYAPYDAGYGYGNPGGYYGPGYGVGYRYGYPYGAARVGPVRVFWR